METTWIGPKLLLYRRKMVDRAGDIAQMVVPYGIYIEDYLIWSKRREIAHIDLIDEELLNKDRTKGIIHVYISPEENLRKPFHSCRNVIRLKEFFTIDTADCVMEDWLNN